MAAPITLSPEELTIAAKGISEEAESFNKSRENINRYIEDMIVKDYVSADAVAYVNQIRSQDPVIIRMYNTMNNYVDYCVESGGRTIQTREDNVANIKSNMNFNGRG